jgi:hypothetical protein
MELMIMTREPREPPLPFHTTTAAKAAAAKCRAVGSDPDIEWRAVASRNGNGRFYVAAFIGRDLIDVL